MDRHIKDILGQYLVKSKISSGYQSDKILKIWKNKMGPNIAQQTKYFRLYDGVLTIKIESSVLKFELFQNIEQIKAMLNDEIGSDLITKVKFQ